MTAPATRYVNFLMDNARWNEVSLREDDIIISTPAKCGTTWTQTICALLVFAEPELPAHIDDLSPWVEAYLRPLDRLLTDLDAQRHRRFVKSHLPFDGLPFDERVTYVCVGRDPRDAGISMDHHMANMNMETVMALRAEAIGPEFAAVPEGSMPPPAETLRKRFWNWVDGDYPVQSLTGLMAHLKSFWDQRNRPNVVMLHYADLKSDLEGQMRMLGDRLGIEIDEQTWPGLVRAATFDTMRGNAETLAPEREVWKDKAEFFHKGTSGQWKELLDDDDLKRYRERVAALADPELLEWVHQGAIA